MNHSLNYAQAIVESILKAKSGEEATIFTDESLITTANDLAESLARAGAEITIFMIPETLRPILKITDIHASALVSSDIVIYVLTTESGAKDLSKEVAFRHFLYTLPLQHKGRVCMMPGFTDEMKEAVMINYDGMRRRGDELRQVMSGKQIRITSKLGTDVSFSLGNRRLEIDDGNISKPGQFGNIPAGEIFTAPIEETVSGKIVIDGSVGGIGIAAQPFTIYIRGGEIEHMEPLGSPDEIFKKFSKVIEYDTPASKTVGEFGIGLNPGARIIGKMLMDEKVEGTIHFAFGDSYGLGKTQTKYHTDLLIRNPTIIAGEAIIMKEGIFL
jgi:aminopeptidase